jgi:O-antigen/teichoic acid export membrane protein
LSERGSTSRGGSEGRSGRERLSNALIRGASGALVIRLAGTGLAFGLQVLLARLLGVGPYGDYIYAFSVVTFLSGLLKLGLDATTVRFLSTYRASGKWGLIRGFLRRTLQLQTASALAGTLLMLLVVWLLGGRLDLDLKHTLLLSALVLPALTLQFLAEARLRALSRVALGRIPQEIIQPILVGALVAGALLLTRGEVDAPTAMTATLLAVSSAVALGFVLFRAFVPREVLAAAPEYQTRHWTKTAVQLSLVASGFVVLAQIDVLLSGYYLGTAQAGTYSVASRISRLVPFGLTAVNLAISPMISRLWEEQRHSELQRIVTLAAAGIILTTLPVSLVCAIFAEPLLSLFGDDFAGARGALIVLVLGRTFGAFSGPTSLLLTMTGRQMLVVKVLGVSAAIDIALHVVLLPRFGIMGAAAATTITLVVWNVILTWFVFRRMRLDPTIVSLLLPRNWRALRRGPRPD